MNIDPFERVRRLKSANLKDNLGAGADRQRGECHHASSPVPDPTHHTPAGSRKRLATESSEN